MTTKNALITLACLSLIVIGTLVVWGAKPNDQLSDRSTGDSYHNAGAPGRSESKEQTLQPSIRSDRHRDSEEMDGGSQRQMQQITFDSSLPDQLERYRSEWRDGNVDAGWAIANIYGTCAQSENEYHLESLQTISNNDSNSQAAAEANERLAYLESISAACEKLDVDPGVFATRFEEWALRAAEHGNHAAMRHFATGYPQEVISSDDSESERDRSIYEHDQRRVEYLKTLRSECDPQGIIEIGNMLAMTEPFMSGRVSKESLYYGDINVNSADANRLQSFAHRYAGLMLKGEDDADVVARNWSSQSGLSPHLESTAIEIAKSITSSC